jgi:hypothetical protein
MPFGMCCFLRATILCPSCGGVSDLSSAVSPRIDQVLNRITDPLDGPAVLARYRMGCVLVVLALLIGAGTTQAQPRLFGSWDDAAEIPNRGWWLADRHAEFLGGFSLIGAQWRTVARLRAHLESAYSVLEVDGSVRAGIYGRYGVDSDEPYDLLRVLRYARYSRGQTYVRVGTPTRSRLGLGHLVDFYNGGADWDGRRMGAEVAVSGRRLRIFGLSSDVAMNRLLAGRIEIRPSAARGLPGSIWIGFGAVSDQSIPAGGDPQPPDAYEVDIQFTAAESGAFAFRPFASAASFRRYGRGLLLGADIEADNFIDLARVHARLAIQYSDRQFRPGYFGSFYDVQNPTSAIVSSDSDGSLAGVPLKETAKGTYVYSELRLHFFDRFEFFYAFRRHFGAQALSSYHLRVFLHTSRFRFRFSEDRGGLRGFFSLLNSVGDQSLMSFQTEYRLTGPLWLRVDARYGYLQLPDSGGQSRYAVQRRFEPYLGLRIAL